MEIDWLPIGLFGSFFFWVLFIILGLLMPFFVFLNTFILGKISREIKNLNKCLGYLEKLKEREMLGKYPNPNE